MIDYKKVLPLLLILALGIASPVYATLSEDMRGKISREHKIVSIDSWYGGERIKFDFEGHTAWLVVPKGKPAEGRPWTWTMQWATAFVPRTAVPELISKGWFHVTLEAFEEKASEEFLPTFDRFQKYLVDSLGLAPKACLIGMSWGGFYSTRYACAYPSNVKAIYLDAPLLTFEGRNRSIGPWASSLPAGGSWKDDPRMPVNKAEALAQSDIPVLLLYGKDDKVVDPAQNCELFASRFKAVGGRIEIEARPMWDHHPHGLDPGYTDRIRKLFEGTLFADKKADESPVTYLPEWKAGFFDIHNISTGKGDATFIVYPDGTTFLIDTGDMMGINRYPWLGPELPDSTRTPAGWVVKYIRNFVPSIGKIDYMSVTHFHSDHMGSVNAAHPGKNGYQVCGVSEVGESIPFAKIVDRGYPGYDYPSAEYISTKCPCVSEYRKFVDFQVKSGQTEAESFIVGSHKQFRPLRDAGSYDFDVWNVAGNCVASTGKGMKTKQMYKDSEDPEKFDENMFSTAILFRYGRFRYFNGGDIGGWSNPKGAADRDRDYESQIADLIGPCDVVKANHHASRDVMNPNFLWTVRPDVILLPCTATNHPQPETLDRMHDYQYPGKRLLFPTSNSGAEMNGEERMSWMHPWGHVVVRVYPGGNTYQVFVLDVMSGDYRIRYSTEKMTTK